MGPSSLGAPLDTIGLQLREPTGTPHRKPPDAKSVSVAEVSASATDTDLAKMLLIGVALGGSTKAYPFDLLSGMLVINDSLGGGEVFVYLESDTDTALVYDREVDGRVLIFSTAEDGHGAFAVLVDAETGSRWLALTGKAIDGLLESRVLNRALSHLSFWFAWKDCNPDTEVY